MAGEREQPAAERIAELEAEVARLQAQVEDARFVSELRARLAQVGATGTLSVPTEHAALLELIVQAAMHVLHAQAGSLYLVDEDAQALVWEVALGERAAGLVGQRIPLGQGVAGWVAATGQAIAVADVQQDPRWAQEVGRAVGYLPRTEESPEYRDTARLAELLSEIARSGDAGRRLALEVNAAIAAFLRGRRHGVGGAVSG